MKIILREKVESMSLQSRSVHAEQNDITKRFNSILMEMVRSISGDSQLPKSSWAEASANAVNLWNQSTTKSGEKKTPLYDTK